MVTMKSKIDWQWKKIEQMTAQELEKMFSLRQEVFIVEQNCPYADIDGKDSMAHHLLVWKNNSLIANLRVFESYHEYGDRASIGRICVASSVRKYGIGKELVQNAIDFIAENYPKKEIQIGAQFYLKNFYEKLGFSQISDIYDEDGIEHILMRR